MYIMKKKQNKNLLVCSANEQTLIKSNIRNRQQPKLCLHMLSWRSPDIASQTLLIYYLFTT